MHDGRAALYCRMDWPTSRMDGEKLELRLSWQQEARNLIKPGVEQTPRSCGHGWCLQAHLRRVGANTGVADFSIRAERNPPGQFSDLNGFDDPQACHVDDRDVV